MKLNKTGELLKKLREQKGMTQDQLAKELFVDRTLVNKWEKGVTCIPSGHLKKISDIFDVSLEELISGELLTKDNYVQVSEAKYKIYENYLKNKKILKVLFIILIIILLLFFAYFFFTFYNSVSIYNIHVDSSEIELNDGVFIKTRDYLIFDFNINREDVKELTLYSNIYNKEQNILKTNNTDIYIKDYVDNQEYFDFDDINNIIKNLYLKVEYDDGKIIDIKLNINKMYSNKKIFVKAKKGAVPIDDSGTKEISNSVLREKYEEVYNKYPDSTKRIKVNNIDYEMVIFEKCITIYYIENHENYILSYKKFDFEYISKLKNGVDIYSDVIEKDKCKRNDCNDDINLLIKIMDYLLNNKK